MNRAMSADTDRLEHDLVHDLQSLVDALADDSLAEELYRSLASTAWGRPGSGDGRVTVSWKRAEDIVNGLREQGGHPPLTLAQTGGEGEVGRRVAEALGARGWTRRPQDTRRHDAAHADSPPDPPPKPHGGNPALERAHEDADDQRRRRLA